MAEWSDRMLDVVRGVVRRPAFQGQLAAPVTTEIRSMELSGVLFLGYPVLFSVDERIDVDGLLLSEEHGLVSFLFSPEAPVEGDAAGWADLEDQQDSLHFALRASLSRHDALRHRRDLGFDISVITVFPSKPDLPVDLEDESFVGVGELQEAVSNLQPIPPEYWRPLNAALQRVTTIRPAKRRTNVTRGDSRGGIIQRIEGEIANLDRWQKAAAIEMPEGPQRIRGLAGSGKTVVLALKAAYLHTQRPSWDIAVVFYTRSLYQQFKDLIQRFTLEHSGEDPNWEKLKLLHAWGGAGRPGMYSEIAGRLGSPVRSFQYASAKFGSDDGFRGICTELLVEVTSSSPDPMFDVVLIDEAQDLPEPFFQLVHEVTREPKRIVWAYDDLQKLSEATMPSTRDLFGVDSNGNPRVELPAGTDDAPRSDIVLPTCYRNTPWALTLAHGLGLGVYRDGGLVQYFDDPKIWSDVGYATMKGSIEAAGSEVVLRRAEDSYPAYFDGLLQPDDAISTHRFAGPQEQAEWIADSIATNLMDDELQPDDILVILPNAYTAKSAARTVMRALEKRGISAHLAGVTSSPDELFSRDSVAIANIYRSKGNEAPMVYVLNSHECHSGYELLRLRNTLFTAITRSRAWVRICGWGEVMDSLVEEIQKVRESGFQLQFTVPTEDDLRRMRTIHRDRTADELGRIQAGVEGAKGLVELIKAGELSPESLPPELRTSLAQLFVPDESDDEFGA